MEVVAVEEVVAKDAVQVIGTAEKVDVAEEEARGQIQQRQGLLYSISGIYRKPDSGKYICGIYM